MPAYDVVVIGGGPAGATTALRLAQRGVRVALVEKEQLPRYKPCGGGLTDGALRFLPDLDLSSVTEDAVDNAVFGLNGRTLYHWHSPRDRQPAILMVMRDRFDQLLVEQAAAHGAEVRTGSPVRAIEREDAHFVVRTGRDTLHARVLVGADGAKGPTARALGLRAGASPGVALEAEVVPDDPREQERFRRRMDIDFLVVRTGYGWVFPKAQHLSIGVGSFYARAGDLRRLLDEYLRAKLRSSWRVLHLQGHPLPVTRGPETLHSGAACLVGDAAGLIEPLWGEGIAGAVESAHLAAAEIGAFLAEEVPDLAGYSAAVARQIQTRFDRGRTSQRLLYGVLGAARRLLPSAPGRKPGADGPAAAAPG